MHRAGADSPALFENLQLMGKDFKQQSKENWSGQEIIENINAGSLQRIADATEKMAGNYTRLQNDCDLYKRWYEAGREERNRLANRIKALKGVITKQKKQIAELKNK